MWMFQLTIHKTLKSRTRDYPRKLQQDWFFGYFMVFQLQMLYSF
jgi:hypothetical protein